MQTTCFKCVIQCQSVKGLPKCIGSHLKPPLRIISGMTLSLSLSLPPSLPHTHTHTYRGSYLGQLYRGEPQTKSWSQLVPGQVSIHLMEGEGREWKLAAFKKDKVRSEYMELN